MSDPTKGEWNVESCHGSVDVYHEISTELSLGSYGVVADTLNRDYRIGPEEDEANARILAASKKLFAYAECQEAADLYDRDGSGFTKKQLHDVLSRHGFQGNIDFTHYGCLSFIRDLRTAALAKARGALS